jgi:FolB domain-containing protein
MQHTVDYKALKVRVREFVESSSFFLIEKLATEIARICLKPERVQRAIVKVEKPGALRFARTVAVEVDRTRDEFFGDTA